jgi:GAF domain-containing protein
VGFGLVYLENTGAIEIALDEPQTFARDIAFIFVLFATFLYIVISSLRNALSHALLTSRELQKNNEELRILQSNLESRVADRTKALATAAEVSRRLSAVTNSRQLAVEVVEQVQHAFDYYYAQIYLLDEAGENLVLEGGTGEAGAAMIARGHALPVGRGLVGRAAASNEPVLVSDTSQDPDWLPNDMLPETKAEAAVPISVGDQVLGVLDVQHSTVNGLTPDDVTLLESLAGQTAISLQNARSYEESRRRAELESMVNIIGQKIQRTTSIEETLQTAIRELGTAIGATRVRAGIKAAADAGAAKAILPTDPLVAVLEPNGQPNSENSNAQVA